MSSIDHCPEITLKKVDVHEGLSEETFCFTADVYVDRKKTFRASNQGFGGPTDFNSVDQEPMKATWDKVAEINEALAEHHPPIPCSWDPSLEPMKMSLESKVSYLVADHLTWRDIQKQTAKCFYFWNPIDKGFYTIKMKRKMPATFYRDPKNIKVVQEANPDVIIFNGMPKDEALKAYEEVKAV